MPEKSWRLRPYLGYDWIAGVALPRAWKLGVGALACLCTCLSPHQVGASSVPRLLPRPLAQ